MRFLPLLALFLSPAALAGSLAELKTAACSDPYMTTFVRLDRVGAQAVMYGVFFHLPPVSNSYAAAAATVEITAGSPDARYDSFSTIAVDERGGGTRGTLLLAFPVTRADSLGPQETALAAFVDEKGAINSSFVDCYLSF